MSKKRLPQEESSIDKQNIEGSDSEFEEDDCAKRAKLDSLSDTTLQDLPIEVLEYILVNVVVMEVKGLKLAKSAWKEKADPVIARLGSVCSRWSSTLTTNFFRNELHRTLDSTAQETIRLEILQQSRHQSVVQCATMHDEIFLLCKPQHGEYFINVYDRNNIAEESIKDVIPLPGLRPKSIAPCSVSNCVYVLNKKGRNHVSIMRIARDGGHWVVSMLIREICLPRSMLSVSASGSLILVREQSKTIDGISVYDGNGSLQQTVRTPLGISRFWKIIPKSGGNIVLVSIKDNNHIELTEIELDGTVVRQYESSIDASISMFVSEADQHGRVLLADEKGNMELLDSEFNPIHVTCPQLDEDLDIHHQFQYQLHYNSKRNEFVAALIANRVLIDYADCVLTIFQLREI